ncbi:ATP-binding cassette domain-containing protein [Pseudarthrobacter sp. YS3]|uniref:ABC transporter ATP-binding protein n=1 Tax=Pseudarthrobacter sp. YS3 TaxID=3453718 RepID=UPI003EEF8B39
MTPAIRTTGLTKAFGRKLALDAVDLTVESGAIFGFLGPNGAGKTTMIRILAGLAQASSGSVEVLGHDVAGGDPLMRSTIGFLPDVPAFYSWMNAHETLRFAGQLCGLNGVQLDERAALLLGLAGLERVTAKVGDYSRGMRQRLGLAQALINAPSLLLLDEPTSALDPMGRKDILEFVESLRGRTTVFFSTHILADVERVCDSVAILDQGRVVAQGPMEELKNRYGRQRIVLEVTDGADELAAAISRCSWAMSVAPGPQGEISVTVSDLAAARHQIPVLVSAQGTGLARLEAGELGLEEVFVELIKGDRP